jgi:hypothetical protein
MFSIWRSTSSEACTLFQNAGYRWISEPKNLQTMYYLRAGVSTSVRRIALDSRWQSIAKVIWSCEISMITDKPFNWDSLKMLILVEKAPL